MKEIKCLKVKDGGNLILLKCEDTNDKYITTDTFTSLSIKTIYVSKYNKITTNRQSCINDDLNYIDAEIAKIMKNNHDKALDTDKYMITNFITTYRDELKEILNKE